MLPLLFAALLAGCAKPPPEPVVEMPVDGFQAAPRLPNPRSAVYLRPSEPPSDPMIAIMTRDSHWNTNLAGVAAWIALELSNGKPPPLPWQVREAAWRSGWPHPMHNPSIWAVGVGHPPPVDVAAWINRHEEHTIGLVRARSAQGDVWVGLSAAPRVTLPSLPRQVTEDRPLVLPPLPALRFTLVAADGAVSSGSLERGLRVNATTPGESLLVLEDELGVVARFPFYTDIEPPNRPVWVTPAGTDNEAKARVETLRQLGALRGSWDFPALERDDILDAAASAWLDDPSRPVHELVAGLGVEGGHTSGVLCEGARVVSCLDHALWDAHQRANLLHPTATLVGIGARPTEAGWKLAVVLADPKSLAESAPTE